MGKVSPRPVQHRHEVVANDAYSSLCDLLETFSVSVKVHTIIAILLFDVLRHRQALHNGPSKT